MPDCSPGALAIGGSQSLTPISTAIQHPFRYASRFRGFGCRGRSRGCQTAWPPCGYRTETRNWHSAWALDTGRMAGTRRPVWISTHSASGDGCSGTTGFTGNSSDMCAPPGAEATRKAPGMHRRTPRARGSPTAVMGVPRKVSRLRGQCGRMRPTDGQLEQRVLAQRVAVVGTEGENARSARSPPAAAEDGGRGLGVRAPGVRYAGRGRVHSTGRVRIGIDRYVGRACAERTVGDGPHAGVGRSYPGRGPTVRASSDFSVGWKRR